MGRFAQRCQRQKYWDYQKPTGLKQKVIGVLLQRNLKFEHWWHGAFQQKTPPRRAPAAGCILTLPRLHRNDSVEFTGEKRVKCPRTEAERGVHAASTS